MRSNLTTNIVVTLVLSHDEAKWLNAQMQNPLHDIHPNEENSEDAEMRKKFFEATQDAAMHT